jgi:very-short-patch-repair endonuclease
MNIFNKNSTKEKRKELRKNQTKAEKIMWNKLRGKQFCNMKFFRQYGIDEYIADFYNTDLKLVIEIDGNIHFEKNRAEYDEIRTKFFNSIGIKVIRFKNEEIENKLEEVLIKLRDEILKK